MEILLRSCQERSVNIQAENKRDRSSVFAICGVMSMFLLSYICEYWNRNLIYIKIWVFLIRYQVSAKALQICRPNKWTTRSQFCGSCAILVVGYQRFGGPCCL